jgi:three-Cys-motif partner protein
VPVDEVIWDAPEHTKAKHKILKGYLDAWAPIMSQRATKFRSRPPLYVDAFAGPGVYKDGTDGSPLVAIKAVLEHARPIPSPIRMTFIEVDTERFEILRSKLSGIPHLDRSRVIVEGVLNTTCQEGLRELIDTEKRRYGSLGSALVFLDQFGYSQSPMAMIGEIMAGDSCETLIYLDYQRMNHTLTDPNKEAALTKAFGSREWEIAAGLEGRQRVASLRNSYKSALYGAGAAYVWDFEMRGQRNELLSWLFFCTSNEKGLVEMKKAMYQLDLTGNFRFSDRDVQQLNLLAKSFDPDWLADHLHGHFKEEAVSHGAIRKYVLTETPPFKYKEALQKLEAADRLRVQNPPSGRRKGSFKFDDSVLIEFLRNPGKQGSLF